MARIEDIYEPTRSNVIALECKPLAQPKLVAGPALAKRRVSVSSTQNPRASGAAGFGDEFSGW